MELLSLPLEILHHIHRNLRASDLSAYSRTCRFVHALVNPYFYPHLAKKCPPDNLRWIIAKKGNADAARKVLEAGLNLDEFYEAIRTSPLMIASRTGHLEIVWMCIEKFEPCPNKQVSSHTPLTVAAAEGHLEVARYLVAHGATPNVSRSRRGPRRWAELLQSATLGKVH